MDTSSRYERARPLLRLGEILRDTSPVAARLDPLFPRQCQQHSWFTPAFCRLATETVASWLQDSILLPVADKCGAGKGAMRIALLPDGTTPLSGFRELAFILLGGHSVVMRAAPHDLLLPALVDLWGNIEPSVRERIRIEEKLADFDAVVADIPAENGDALQRYFAHFPHCFRRSYCRATLIEGEETEEELRALARDICHYFGRSTRATRKLYVPDGYDFVPLLHILQEESRPLADHNRFLNHLDYQKSIRLMSSQYYMDAGTFLLVENSDPNPPVAVLHYNFYHNDSDRPSIGQHDGEVMRTRRDGTPFGQAHSIFFEETPDNELIRFLGLL